jgi:hypothetical protein
MILEQVISSTSSNIINSRVWLVLPYVRRCVKSKKISHWAIKILGLSTHFPTGFEVGCSKFLEVGKK